MNTEETPLKENCNSDIENNKTISSYKKINKNQGCCICLCSILSIIFMIVSLCLCERNLPDYERMCS